MVILKLLKKLLKGLLKYLVKALELIFLLIEKAIQYFSKLVSKLKWYSYLGFFFSLFVTFWGFYTYYEPKFDIEFKEPLRPDNSFSSLIDIHNTGNCNIYNFKISYKLSDFNARIKNVIKIQSGGGDKTVLRSRLPTEEIIVKNKKKTIDFDLAFFLTQFTGDIDDVSSLKSNLTLYIEYEYWGKKFTKVDSLKFKTSELVHGKMIWLSN